MKINITVATVAFAIWLTLHTVALLYMGQALLLVLGMCVGMQVLRREWLLAHDLQPDLYAKKSWTFGPTQYLWALIPCIIVGGLAYK